MAGNQSIPVEQDWTVDNTPPDVGDLEIYVDDGTGKYIPINPEEEDLSGEVMLQITVNDINLDSATIGFNLNKNKIIM